MRHGPPGVFNQQDDPSIWNDSGSAGPPNLHEHLARVTGGASRTSNTHTLLAQLYRPPFEIISPLSWEDARTEGKENSKWLLINIQDPSIFDCQILNRDIWKHEGIRDTVNESFVFLQYNKDDLRGVQYIQYYFPAHDSGDAYPHIAIVDPRTGEQVKVWSGPPAPKASEFLMQLHEFLDRYSLSATARNPVAKRKPEKKRGVDSMSEQEQLEIAMQASLANQIGSNNSNNDLLTPNNDDDPDALTRSIGDLIDLSNPSTSIPTPKKDDQQRQQQSLLSSTSSSNGTPQPSVFDLISSTTPYTEPLPTAPNTTRIQFRHPSGRRIVHRFLLSDPIRRIYEMLKADALKESDSKPFELVYMGRNLIGELDLSIQDAGLKNGTVMVEFHVDELS